MKLKSILNRYILTEILGIFSVTFSFLCFISLMTQLLDLTQYIVVYGVSATTFFLMLSYSLPFFLQYVIPASIMISVLLTFIRMSNDNEITALKAGGVSIYRLIIPVFLFSLLGCFLTGIITLYSLPRSGKSLNTLLLELAVSNLQAGLKEKTFNENFHGMMLYVTKIDSKTNTLVDIFIEDQRNPEIVSTIVAPKGSIDSNRDNLDFHLKLYNGIINQVSQKNKTAHTIQFDLYDLRFDLKDFITSKKTRLQSESDMSIPELRQYIAGLPEKDYRYYRALKELHTRFSFPFSCIMFGFLAVPLGIQTKVRKKASGIALGLLFFLLYYILYSIGRSAGESGLYPPAIGMWVPNLVIGAIGFFLFTRTVNERPIQFGLFMRLSKRMKP